MEIVALILAALLFAGFFSWPYWYRRTHAELEPIRTGCQHDEKFLVPVNNSAFGLVATLCTNCFEQLDAKVWQKKLDRELAELDPAPAKPLPQRFKSGQSGKMSDGWSIYKRNGWKSVQYENQADGSTVMTIASTNGCSLALLFKSLDHRLHFLNDRGFGEIVIERHSPSCLARRSKVKPKPKPAYHADDVYLPVEPNFDAAVLNPMMRALQMGHVTRAEAASWNAQVGAAGAPFHDLAAKLGIEYSSQESFAAFAKRVKAAQDARDASK